MTARRPDVVPTATYRLQLGPGQGFADVAARVGYLHALGVSHVYLSPVLQAVPGSTHGYDVVDQTQLSEDLGGAAAFDGLVGALAARGMGVVVDVVPNHMAVPTPADLNLPLWSVLRDGPASPYAAWFDVEWDVPGQALLMPVLGRRIGECLAAGELVADRTGREPVLRYHDKVFPIRPGTEDLRLPDLLDAQHYRLAYWRVGDEELNYRRFFDVDSLVAVRVEDPAVFSLTHALLVALGREGKIDGFRIDHPDGLADPRGYLRRLATATGSAWVVVEKILEGDERLPSDWACAGTTGYDALRLVGGLFVDPAGERPLRALHARLTNVPDDPDAVVEEAKRHAATRLLAAEVDRLVELASAVCQDDVRLRDHTKVGLAAALVELLVAMPVYRAYVVPGEPPDQAAVDRLDAAAATARARVPDRAAEVDLLHDLALGRHGRGRHQDRFVVRFQQACGPVMAKGIEDTAFYRYAPLAALAEVGGDPDDFGWPAERFHAFAARLQRDWPATMTTLSTHDTKRSEDVRARLAVIAEVPDDWERSVQGLSWLASAHRLEPDAPDPATEYLLWQNLLGAWPVDAARMHGFAEKACREAKTRTSWQTPDPGYEAAVHAWLDGLLADPAVRAGLDSFAARIAGPAAVNVLGQKVLQLTMPGVPDVYQGCETVERALVDPDNRRAVRWDDLAGLLDRTDSGAAVGDLADDEALDVAKLRVTATALRLRREHPDWFGPDGGYHPLRAVGPAAEHLVGFMRADHVVTLATRLPLGLARYDGWRTTSVDLPSGPWTDRLTGRTHEGGRQRLGSLLADLPVALLTRG